MYIGLQWKYRYCCQVLITLEPSRHISEKYVNTQFHKNPPRASRVITWGQTNTHDETNSEKRLQRCAVQQNDIRNHSTLLQVSSDREPSGTLPVTQITRSTVYRPSSHREAQ